LSKPADRDNQKYSPRNSTYCFADLIRNEFNNTVKLVPANIEKTEPLAFLDYEEEIRIKQKALSKFLTDNHIKGKPEEIIKSPMDRNYRTTSKRKVHFSRDKFYFLFAEESYPTKPDLFRPSLLEPVEHKTIYEFLCALINQPGYAFLGNSLNYIIIRGNYSEFSIIFNISKINADVIRKLKGITDKLRQLPVNIISTFAYYDPTNSEYYLESERPEKEVTYKKFFGPDTLFLKLNEKKYSYHPTSFSQINESILPLMIAKLEKLLSPSADQQLYDLFCGYGLFACSLAGMYKETTGIEIAGESIKSAAINAKYLAPKSKTKFIAKKITAETLEQCLPGSVTGMEVFLLDPPRNGTENGVIKVIAERNPIKVIHIFCSVDEIKRGVEEWNKCGYSIKSISPLDMFPGSPNLEVIIVLTKQK